MCSLGGLAGAIVTSPFDVVKTRLQSDLFRYDAPQSGVKETVRAAQGGGRGGVSGGLYQFVDTIILIR